MISTVQKLMDATLLATFLEYVCSIFRCKGTRAENSNHDMPRFAGETHDQAVSLPDQIGRMS